MTFEYEHSGNTFADMTPRDQRRLQRREFGTFGVCSRGGEALQAVRDVLLFLAYAHVLARRATVAAYRLTARLTDDVPELPDTCPKPTDEPETRFGVLR